MGGGFAELKTKQYKMVEILEGKKWFEIGQGEKAKVVVENQGLQFDENGKFVRRVNKA